MTIYVAMSIMIVIKIIVVSEVFVIAKPVFGLYYLAIFDEIVMYLYNYYLNPVVAS